MHRDTGAISDSSVTPRGMHRDHQDDSLPRPGALVIISAVTLSCCHHHKGTEKDFASIAMSEKLLLVSPGLGMTLQPNILPLLLRSSH